MLRYWLSFPTLPIFYKSHDFLPHCEGQFLKMLDPDWGGMILQCTVSTFPPFRGLRSTGGCSASVRRVAGCRADPLRVAALQSGGHWVAEHGGCGCRVSVAREMSYGNYVIEFWVVWWVPRMSPETRGRRPESCMHPMPSCLTCCPYIAGKGIYDSIYGWLALAWEYT